MKKKYPTDEEDLVGDFVGETGQPQLLFNQALGVHGGDEDDYVPLDRSEKVSGVSSYFCAVCGNKKKTNGKRKDTKTNNYYLNRGDFCEWLRNVVVATTTKS